MDDGSPIRLAVTIDARDGSATFDFEGTGPEVYGNCNAPPAVAYSAIIYALRCMARDRGGRVGGLLQRRCARCGAAALAAAGAPPAAALLLPAAAAHFPLHQNLPPQQVTRDIPLNQGCLAPITVRIPPACLLNPSPEAAVVGGNVLTSQRVTDVVLKAFSAAAASQGAPASPLASSPLASASQPPQPSHAHLFSPPPSTSSKLLKTPLPLTPLPKPPPAPRLHEQLYVWRRWARVL